MARKLRGGKEWQDVRAGEAERNKPIVLRNSTETYSINQPNQLNQSSIGESYNKMIGQAGGGGSYGSMSSLESASMRLADAASKRTMAESEKEYGLKSSQLAQTSGYSSPLKMQQDLQKERDYQRAYQNALASGKKGTYSGSWGSFRI
jgi:hypothetical protein